MLRLRRARVRRLRVLLVNDQAEYARLSALVELRLRALREALDRHEADQANWTRTELLVQVEHGLAELVARLGTR